MSIEGRGIKRRHLILYLEVFDAKDKKLLGHLVDLSTKGIKIVSKEKIEVDKNFQLQMMLPEGYFEERKLRFKGKSLWCNNASNPDFYDTGFGVSNLNTKAYDIIQKLITELGFLDK